jgi:hypothetical protein
MKPPDPRETLLVRPQWKVELQQLADELGEADRGLWMRAWVPANGTQSSLGCSFTSCGIGAAVLLISRGVVVKRIGNTTTAAGLRFF